MSWKENGRLRERAGGSGTINIIIKRALLDERCITFTLQKSSGVSLHIMV